MADMGINLCGVEFKNPVIAASGTFAFGAEMNRFYSNDLLGGIALKGITLEPRIGNDPPRIAETPSGVLNSVGLQNPGIDYFVETILPWIRKKDTVLISNISGNSSDEYIRLAQRLSDTDIDMIEMNISCPNIHAHGESFGARPESVASIVNEVKPFCKKPLIVKLSPNTADIRETALAAEENGADALSLINTITGMAIDINSRRPILANIIGGLSGPAVRPIALRMVYQASSVVRIPIIGLGGIYTGSDAIEFLLCGASAVGVGTATLSNPNACVDVIKGIEDYLDKYNYSSVNDIIGKLEV